MSQATAKTSRPGAARTRRSGKPFFGAIEPVIVEDPVEFEFDGAVTRSHAAAAWTWMARDVAPDLLDHEADEATADDLANFLKLLPELFERADKAMALGGKTAESERRLVIQVGGGAPYRRLPNVLNALRCRALIEKAQVFGRAANHITEEEALDKALQSMPLNDPQVASVLMQATMGQVANPSRFVMAAIRIAGSANERDLMRAGFGPLFDAILSHGQNQIPQLMQTGTFADIDLTCRAIDRFHRLFRSIHNHIELDRNSRWTTLVGALTKSMSDRIEPKLRNVVMDVNKALRRQRDGADRLDSDQILSALNGIYVLCAVRDARDSLALNALFGELWGQVGQAIEAHVQRNLELFRDNPADRIVAERLDATIKMAELRFNGEYAEILRRAKEAAEKH